MSDKPKGGLIPSCCCPCHEKYGPPPPKLEKPPVDMRAFWDSLSEEKQAEHLDSFMKLIERGKK